MPKETNDKELDLLIVSNRKLEAIQLLRQQGLSLASATEALVYRYRQLRTKTPDRVTCEDKEYWQGFYS